MKFRVRLDPNFWEDLDYFLNFEDAIKSAKEVFTNEFENTPKQIEIDLAEYKGDTYYHVYFCPSNSGSDYFAYWDNDIDNVNQCWHLIDEYEVIRNATFVMEHDLNLKKRMINSEQKEGV